MNLLNPDDLYRFVQYVLLLLSVPPSVDHSYILLSEHPVRKEFGNRISCKMAVKSFPLSILKTRRSLLILYIFFSREFIRISFVLFKYTMCVIGFENNLILMPMMFSLHISQLFSNPSKQPVKIIFELPKISQFVVLIPYNVQNITKIVFSELRMFEVVDWILLLIIE